MRIVSLVPGLTELVTELESADLLVGVSDACPLDEEHAAGIERVGSAESVDPDRVIALKPGLVLVSQEASPPDLASRLGSAGIKVVCAAPKDSLQVAAVVREIGDLLERNAQAEKIAALIEEHTKVVRAELFETAILVSFAYLTRREPLTVANEETYACALLDQAGGKNLFNHREQVFSEVTPDELNDKDPDVVLLNNEPGQFEESHIDELVTSTGLERQQFDLVDGALLSRFGPRTPQAVDYGAKLVIHHWDRLQGLVD